MRKIPVSQWPPHRGGYCELRELAWAIERRIAARDAGLVGWLAENTAKGKELLERWEFVYGVTFVAPLREAARREFLTRRGGFERQANLFGMR